MLNRRIDAAATKPTEEELQAMAKAAYDDLLTEICTDQRSTPYFSDHHGAANLAFADYYDRLARNGGHMLRARVREGEAVRLTLSGRSAPGQRRERFTPK